MRVLLRSTASPGRGIARRYGLRICGSVCGLERLHKPFSMQYHACRRTRTHKLNVFCTHKLNVFCTRLITTRQSERTNRFGPQQAASLTHEVWTLLVLDTKAQNCDTKSCWTLIVTTSGILDSLKSGRCLCWTRKHKIVTALAHNKRHP